VAWLRGVLERYEYRVLMINERRTSKACADCGSKLGIYAVNEHMYTTDSPRPWRVERDKSNRRRHVTLHGLVRCSHCGLAHCRDANAVRNMIDLVAAALRNQPRPAYLDTMREAPKAKEWQMRYKPRDQRDPGKPRVHSRGERRRVKQRAEKAAERAAAERERDAARRSKRRRIAREARAA